MALVMDLSPSGWGEQYEVYLIRTRTASFALQVKFLCEWQVIIYESARVLNKSTEAKQE
jgi:hypothetical protein